VPARESERYFKGHTRGENTMRKPAPATIIALVALFVALGGSGYAAVSISGKSIRNRSIAGKKLKKNTLTGTEINESKLGTVPSAGNSALLAGLGPSAFLGATAKAADSDKLDGKDSTDFLGATAKAADSDKLDGLDSTAFVPASVLRSFGPLSVSNTDGLTLAVIGQLTFNGTCFDLSGTQGVQLYIGSSVAHAAYADLTQAGAGTTYGNADMGQFGTLASVVVPDGTKVFTPVTGEALSADGHQVFYDLYMGQNARGDTGQKCVFGGSFVVQ